MHARRGTSAPSARASASAWATGEKARPRRLMRDADIAMYVAKGKGKGRFSVFEPTDARGRRPWPGAARRPASAASARSSSSSTTSRSCTWRPAPWWASRRWCAGATPPAACCQPRDFIPLAEATGAIVPLGRWILERACRHGRRLGRSPTDGAGPRLCSVNLSACSWSSPASPPPSAGSCAASGLRRAELLLEVTETTGSTRRRGGHLAQLEPLGVRLAIDDFGTGLGVLRPAAPDPLRPREDRPIVRGAPIRRLTVRVADLRHRRPRPAAGGRGDRRGDRERRPACPPPAPRLRPTARASTSARLFGRASLLILISLSACSAEATSSPASSSSSGPSPTEAGTPMATASASPSTEPTDQSGSSDFT